MKILVILASFLGLLILTGSIASADDTRFQSPLDSLTSVKESGSLALSDVLSLVAKVNPTLKSLDWQNKAAHSQLKQARLWSNPELDVEIEEVGWDAPGLKESEFAVSLSQEFELFGQRGARKAVARAEINATALQTKLSAFDLYLETKSRFYALAQTQQRLDLSLISTELAQSIVENINLRISKGAALQSELLLAELEKQRAQLTLNEAQQEVSAAQVNLVALWKGDPANIKLSVESEPYLIDLLNQVSAIEAGIDATRSLLQLESQSALLRAEKNLAKTEARPSITLSGGYKRLEANKSNSLLFGVSLPLPFLNRNQGARESLESQIRSLDYEIDRARIETTASIKSGSIKLRQLIKRHDMLDSLLLPTAENVYQTLLDAYQAGRIPYTQLLEAKRSLNELRLEQSDMLLEIHEQIIALESQTGLIMRVDKEI